MPKKKPKKGNVPKNCKPKITKKGATTVVDVSHCGTKKKK